MLLASSESPPQNLQPRWANPAGQALPHKTHPSPGDSKTKAPVNLAQLDGNASRRRPHRRQRYHSGACLGLFGHKETGREPARLQNLAIPAQQVALPPADIFAGRDLRVGLWREGVIWSCVDSATRWLHIIQLLQWVANIPYPSKTLNPGSARATASAGWVAL